MNRKVSSKTTNRITRSLLALTLIVCMINSSLLLAWGNTYAAQSETLSDETAVEMPEDMMVTCINPLYKDFVSEEDVKEPEINGPLEKETHGKSSPKRIKSAQAYYDTPEEAGEAIRQQLVDRAETITVGCIIPKGGTAQNPLDYAAHEIMNYAMDHTGNPTEGDYIKWQYKGWNAKFEVHIEDVYYVTVNYTITYYTSKAQEDAVTTKVQEILDDMFLDGETNYYKTQKIYKFICDTVEYDFENADKAGDNADPLCYTAYGALFSQKAVCQGYALLLYRMLLEEGIECRIIAGENPYSGDSHGWNLVKLGDSYYHADATRDAGRNDFRYFLKGANTFKDHDAYISNPYEFRGNVNISEDDFDVKESGSYGSEDIPSHVHQWESVYTIDVEATCTTDGSKSVHCANCQETKDPQAIAATGHNYKVSKAATAATCISEGNTEEKTCVICGDITGGQVLPPLKAVYETKITKATATKDGKAVTKCTLCNEIQKQETICKASDIRLAVKAYAYNGKVRKPAVIVKDSQGKILKKGADYTVTYAKGCKSVGKYKVTVKGKGNYSFTKYLYFKINPAKTSISSLTKGADSFTVKWVKKTQTTGYEIQYSTSSVFAKGTASKTVKISSAKTTRKIIKGLKADQKYFVRVRTYKTVDGNKYYGAWSAAKSVKTKY